ncbi:glyoxalase [Leifsonia sp. Root4]|uniref:VOC family protein n=1 Tax=Leifsonia sp. Root4 TaxID=1736525 RepID=UPI0006F6C88D|nr:glyoxalase/bleomycin resistance/dioxygenase family protein [Leifsonia sp. Root4]KQW07811.1 glyoxalase [Leifsonia sp. Root4]
MLGFTNVMAVLPASDLERARGYYKDKLDLEPEMSEDGALIYNIAGARVMLYETSFAGTAQNTALTLEADNLDATMAELRNRGVVFEEYDMPGLKTENGVASMGTERGAWFVDSERNIIGVIERSA